MSRQPDELVLVFNAVPYDPQMLIATCPVVRPIVVQRNAANLGSAGGFAQGIALAHARTRASHFWLLDDDVDPEPGALGALADVLLATGCDPDVCLVSLRTQRWEYAQAATGNRALRVCSDSFYGFSLFRRGKQVQPQLLPGARGADADLHEIGYAPWGGLLLHRSWHERIAPPRADYFLYGDDHEYTLRIRRGGGRLLLCSASRVAEQEPSWDRTVVRGRHALLDDGNSDLRAFLSLRNRVATERALTVRSRWRYCVNAAVFAVLVLLRSPAMWRRPRALAKRVRLLSRAVHDGWTGRLGVPTLH
jgi:hypothetical protein